MATDWQRFLAGQMARFGVDPALMQAAPELPVNSMPSSPMLTQGPPPRMYKRTQEPPPPRPTQYQDPSDVRSQAIQEIRNTYEYVEAANAFRAAGMSPQEVDQNAVLLVMRNALAGQGYDKPPIGVDDVVETITSAPGEVAEAGQEAVDVSRVALGLPATDTENPLLDPLQDPDGPRQPEMETAAQLTPQEEEQANTAALELDQWNRIIKPQMIEQFPEETLDAEIGRLTSEIERAEQIPSGSVFIGEGGTEGDLDTEIGRLQLELEQVQAVRVALYGEQDVDPPLYRRVLNFVMGIPGVGKALKAYDKPSEFMRQNMGGWAIRLAANGQLQPGMVLAMGPLGIPIQQMGTTLNAGEINRVYQEGGNAAVWEYAVGRYPEIMGMNEAETALFRGGLDTGFDPLNALGAVAGATKGIPLLGDAANLANVAANVPGSAVLEGARGVGKVAQKTPGLSGLLQPGETAISRAIGQNAEDLAPRLEGGRPEDLNPPPTGPTIGGTPIEPASMGPFTPATTGPRPTYADGTDLSDADFQEYVTRTQAGEDPQVVLESIYVRQEGGTAAEVLEELETSEAAPLPTKADPLADLTGDGSLGAEPQPVAPDEPPRPRYTDATPFTDEDYTRYVEMVRAGENPGEVYDAIDKARIQEIADTGIPKVPEAPTPEPAKVTPAEEVPEVENPLQRPDVPEATAARETPVERPEPPRYTDDPEVMDIPQQLKGTNSPELRKYGIKGYIKTTGGWKVAASNRVKGVQFFAAGQKAWRQLIRSIELDIENGIPIRTATPQPGVRPVDQETAVLVNRYLMEEDPKKAADLIRVLDGPGRNSFIDEAGNRFVYKKGSTWQDMADGRQARAIVSMDGNVSTRLIRNNDGSYAMLKSGGEAPAKIRSLGGLGDAANAPYVPELIERLKAARAQLHKVEPFNAATDVAKPTKGGLQGKFGRVISRLVPDDSLGIIGVKPGSRAEKGLDAYYNFASRLRGDAPDFIPTAEEVDLRDLKEGRLADDLARSSVVGEEERRWLNTPISVDDIRLENLTADERKLALQALGVDLGGRTKAKEIREFLDTVKAQPDFEAPTRGEIYEQLLETVVGDSPQAAQLRLEVWKKIIGGVPAPKGRIGRSMAEMGAMVRHAILYNWVRAPYNTMQDAATNHFVFMVDGQAGVSALHANLMKDYLAGTRAGKGVSTIKNAGIKGTDEVPPFANATIELEAMYDSLDIPLPAIVKSAFGGRFDPDLQRFVENGATWWSDMGRRIGGKPGEVIGSLISSPSVKATRSANDDLMRQAASADFIMRNYNTQYEEFLAEIREVARRYNFDPDEAISRLSKSSKQVFGQSMFSPEDVRRVMNAYNPNQAEHLARRWRGRVNALNRGGTVNVTKNLFSYMPTRLDEQIGRVWMFHYWMTRASAQHARLALEHPNLMAQYVRAFAGMEKMKDRANLPTWARQYVSLMVGPYGMLGLVSPAAVLTGLSVVMDANGVLDDPSAQNLLSVMPFAPIVQAAASVYLNERLPDPTGTNNSRQFAKAALNYLRNEMGVGSAGLTGDPLANLTYKLQELARNIAPGASPLSAPSPGQKDTQLVKYYAAEIMRNTPDPVNGGTLWQNPDGSMTEYASQVMANIDAGLYSGETEREALNQMSSDTMAGRLKMAALPIQSLYPSVVGDARAENRSGSIAANAPLQLDTSSGPIPGGVSAQAFLDPSRPPTTVEAGGSLAVDIGDAGSPLSAQIVAELNQFSNIGTPDTQDLYRGYNNFIYWTGDQLQQKYGGAGLVINGEQFAWEIWNALPQEARRTYMDAWVSSEGRTEELNQYRSDRDAFEAEHPQVAEFKRWQEAVGDQGGQLVLDKLLSGDYPAFEAWWRTQDVKPAYIERTLMGPDAFLALNGYEPSLWDTNKISQLPTTKGPNPLDQIAPPDTSDSGGGSDRPWNALTAEEKVTRLNEKLATWGAEINLFNQQIAPYTGGKSYDALGPSGIAILDAIMQKQNIKMPNPPAIVSDYMDWAYAQPSGSDTSVNAYVASLQDDPTAVEAA